MDKEVAITDFLLILYCYELTSYPERSTLLLNKLRNV